MKEGQLLKPDISTEESENQVRFLDLDIKSIPVEMTRAIRPKYKVNSFLFMSKVNMAGGDFSKGSQELGGLIRNPALEEACFEDPYSHEKIKPSEVADETFQEMERATGRVRIALPGCNLGLEVGGVLDFFNDQGIAIDIDAVDILKAGAERKFMKLEDRQKEQGSSINFHSDTDAREFYRGKQYDVAIFRHPGFVFEPDQFIVWKQIVDTIAETKPNLIILSTYGHKLEAKDDPYFVREVLGEKDREAVYEEEIFNKWFYEHGYSDDDGHSSYYSELLEYPLSCYMMTAEVDQERSKLRRAGEGPLLRFTRPVDYAMVAYGSEEYFANSKTEDEDLGVAV